MRQDPGCNRSFPFLKKDMWVKNKVYKLNGTLFINSIGLILLIDHIGFKISLVGDGVGTFSSAFPY